MARGPMHGERLADRTAERECLLCGSCCFSSSDTHIRVLESDRERLAELADRFTRRIGEHHYLSMEHGRCAALSVEPDGRFVCTIYEKRPAVCRELEPASAACLNEIDENRAVAILALESLVRRG